MAAWRYEISLFVLKKYFSTLEEKFRISARPCNILYVSTDVISIISLPCSKQSIKIRLAPKKFRCLGVSQGHSLIWPRQVCATEYEN